MNHTGEISVDKSITSLEYSLRYCRFLPSLFTPDHAVTCPRNYMKMLFGAFLLSLAGLGNARDIVFPPVLGIDRVSAQIPIRPQSDGDDDVELITDATGGLTSFGHLPYVACFDTKADEDIAKYDIAVLGAPFDTATSYRPGARFGPHGIRDGSRRIRGPHSWNLYSGRNSFQEWAKIVDCGDAPLTFVDNTVALKQLVKAHKVRLSRLYLLLC